MKTSFSWSNFDVNFLKSIINNNKNTNDLKPTFDTDEAFELAPFIEAIAKVPNREFVITFRNEIDFHFLKNNPELVVSVFGKGKGNPNTILRTVTAMPLGEMLINSYLTALYRIGCNDAEVFVSTYTKPISIDLTKTGYNDIKLYDFQKEAIAKLNEFVNNKIHKSGLLVMPTGSGKTRTSVYFLLRDMIANGYQVIWLAHRHLLIDQAAEQFKDMSSLIVQSNPDAKTFNFMCASGKHGTIKAASKKQNLMILSVQTAIHNMDYIKKSLGPKVVVVVDEAHHTVAKSYRQIVSTIRKRRPDALLLGLTATPVRYTDEATTALHALFEKNIIYSVDMNTLIANGTLAHPRFVKVETNIDFEPGITEEEAKKIDKTGELPESVVNRIAQSKYRNDMILEQYFKEDYGKTLIFALNIIHAQMLCDEFKKRKVNCECVYSGKPDNQAIINAYINDKIDVLINVNILTEGSDVPNVETVFLTRPTQSEVLLIQEIGRGMRGKEAGGTESVTIVDFIDKWEVFSNWLSPELIFGDTAFETAPQADKPLAMQKGTVVIPWKDIRSIYRALGSKSGFLKESQSVPFGWFCLEGGEKPYTLLVFENQISGYTELFRHKKEIIENPKISAQTMLTRCFANVFEKPSPNNIKAVLSHLRIFRQQPHLFLLKHRKEIEPRDVAKFIQNNNANIFDVCDRKYEDFEEIINQFYGNLEEYRKCIFNILNYNDYEEKSLPAEIPAELIPYTIDKPHDLQKLYEEVKVEMAEHLRECAQDTGSVTWTDAPIEKYFGCYHANTGNIEINCMLNSSIVPEEVIKYLLYHEMLHRKYHRHDNEFKYMEHKYPDYTTYEKFLDADLYDYKLIY